MSLGVEKIDLMFQIFVKFNDVFWNLFCHASWAGGSLNFRADLALVMIFTDASLRSVGIPDTFHPFGCGKTLWFAPMILGVPSLCLCGHMHVV